MTLYTTGIYADDGKFQQTDIVILPKDFSKVKTEVVFDAKAEFQRENKTITHILKDSTAYVTETNHSTGEITSNCSVVPEMPHIDAIVDTILNGQAVEEDSDFYQRLQCPKSSHSLIHAVWEGLDYFYCFDTTGAELGSFLGPAMIGKVEYLTKGEAAAIEIEAPDEIECEKIDLSQLSASPIDSLDLTESRRRLASLSCSERVRLGQCEFCYDASMTDNKGNNMFNLVSSAFSNLNLDFNNFPDLATNRALSGSISIRKRRLVIYVYEHHGLPCVFIHGAGVYNSGVSKVSEYDWYWGSSTRTNKPPYCSTTHYVKLNTLTRSYKDASLQDELASLLKDSRQSLRVRDGRGGAGGAASALEVVGTILITHGSGGLTVHVQIQSMVGHEYTSTWFSFT